MRYKVKWDPRKYSPRCYPHDWQPLHVYEEGFLVLFQCSKCEKQMLGYDQQYKDWLCRGFCDSMHTSWCTQWHAATLMVIRAAWNARSCDNSKFHGKDWAH
eukprot:g16543.t1